MDIFKITALGLVSCILCIFLKSLRPELSLVLSLLSTLIIMFYILPSLKNVLVTLKELTSAAGIEIEYIYPVFKVIGISYVTEIGGTLCQDAGENAIASKINLAGKIAIISLAMPIAYKMISIIDGIRYSF